jgi:hypothetical protein
MIKYFFVLVCFVFAQLIEQNNLFNTPNGVDLFNNEEALRRSIELVCDEGAGNLLNNLEDISVIKEITIAKENSATNNLRK